MAYDIRKWTANDAERRPRRRHAPWMIGATMLATAIVALAEMLDGGVDERTIPTAIIFVMPLLIAGLLSPFAREAWLTDRGRASYDEFEAAALARATTRAYGLLLGAIAALLAYFWAASANGWPMPRTPLDWSTLAFAMLSVGAALPVMLAEILVPLPPTESDED